MRDFRKLRVWHESKSLALEIYKISKAFPNDEKYGLSSQMRRCSVSIASNIAEGCSRRTSANFAYFIDMSLGSAFELETQLIISKELNYVNLEDYESIAEKINKVQRGMNALRSKVLIRNN